jgi:hypothetical protein
MAAVPLLGLTPRSTYSLWLNGSTANTKSDGSGTIGTDMMLAYTAGANGAWIDRIRLMPVGVTAATSTATTATVARIFLSSQTSGATTNVNTHLWQEAACPAQTVNQTTVAISPVDVAAGFRLEGGETILFCMYHVAAANTAWEMTILGTDY